MSYKSLMTTSKKPSSLVAAVSVVLVAALAGCVSADKRVKQAQEYEAEGRLEKAAQRYIAALSKDPAREDARQSLADVGARMIDDYLAQARAYEQEGRYENAVSALDLVESLRARTDRVGVMLPVPGDYEDFRREMIVAAVASLFQQGEDLEGAGNWPEASRRYERLRAYPLTPDEALAVDEARARVFLRWAEDDMARGLFRSAHGRAQSALAIFGPDSQAGAEALAVQQAALNAGTRTVAVLPFWAAAGAGPGLPRGMENDLYDTLLHEHMEAPVLFVGPIDRGAIHREMSRLRIRSGDIPHDAAIMAGRALGADFVVVGWLESFAQEDGPAETIARKAPLRRDRSTTVTYAEKRYTAKMTAGAAYRIIETASGRAVEEQAVTAIASAQFRRAEYDGDYTTLDLSREERALFDKEGWLQAEEELQAALVDRLAERVAAKIFDRVLRTVR
jgi:tetratricopeptide (TPR) repeat protein